MSGAILQKANMIRTKTWNEDNYIYSKLKVIQTKSGIVIPFNSLCNIYFYIISH